MMALKKGKHIVKEFNGVLCTVVESGITKERMNFLNDLLSLNKYEVVVEETVSENETLYTIGVTDLIFNPMINVYERDLKRKDGTVVSVAFWNQETEEMDLPYFEYREKNPDSPNLDDFLSNPWAYRTIG
jgi:hypothetical protein